jgi:CRISPR/Cas system-associated exonuclease Cas4 (RecB family)
MSYCRTIIVLVGLPGSGKSTIATQVCATIHAQHVQIESYREINAQPADIADSLAKMADDGMIVFECSGASDDFEQILYRLTVNGLLPFVVGVHASLSTAYQRVTARRPFSPPKNRQDWLFQLEWTAVRLGLVPTDLDIDTEVHSTTQAAEAVIRAYKDSQADRDISDFLPDPVTFSKLSKWQVCGREYGYVHVWRTVAPQALPSIVGVSQAVHETLAWLLAPQSPRRSLAELLAVYENRVRKLPSADPETLSRGQSTLTRFYSTHYLPEAKKPLAVEMRVSLPLTGGSSLVGQLDLLTLSLSGELEVVEFKFHQTRSGARPRVPELLQPAAYAAALMAGGRGTRVFVRLQFLEEDQSIGMLLSEQDITRIQYALIRWMQVLRRKGLKANPGQHCRRCAFRGICPSSTAVGD